MLNSSDAQLLNYCFKPNINIKGLFLKTVSNHHQTILRGPIFGKTMGKKPI